MGSMLLPLVKLISAEGEERMIGRMNCLKYVVVLSLILLGTSTVPAQSSSFTYQGRLQDGGTNANGNYDFQFTLWDALSAGTQQPSSPVTLTLTNIAVTGGTFTVQLDFGASAFPGAARFLETRVRPSGGSGFTILDPRQPITSMPYAVRSTSAASADTATTATNATQLGAVAANQYVLTGDARLTDSRSPTVGSASYIQNTTSPQTSSNFSISGNGTVAGNLIAKGNVGIGITVPTRTLDVQSSSGNAVIQAKSTGGGGGVLILDRASAVASQASQLSFLTNGAPDFAMGTSQGTAGVSDFSIYDYGTATNVFTIFKSSGTVVIGTNIVGGAIARLEAVGEDMSGLKGTTNDGAGVIGLAQTGYGVFGQSQSLYGVYGRSNTGIGVVAQSESGNLVEGLTNTGRKFHITNNGTYVAGSDFAEALPALGNRSSYEPGDLLVVSTKDPGKIEKASRPYDSRVAGIYSTRPGMLGADKQGASRVDTEDVPVAIVGIVPTKVSALNGRIRVGDLLTTSSLPGYAMRCANRVRCVGAVVGKALEPLANGQGVIKVLVMLR
jgi:hypothetical protein